MWFDRLTMRNDTLTALDLILSLSKDEADFRLLTSLLKQASLISPTDPRTLRVRHPGQAKREPGSRKSGVSMCYDPG